MPPQPAGSQHAPPLAAQALPAPSTRLSEDGPVTTSASDILKRGDLVSGSAEARLVEVFALIESARYQEALTKAQTLTRDQPHFQLAQLVLGDLLRLRFQPAAELGASTLEQGQAASARLAALRAETRKRLEALKDRPPPGTVPHQFVTLAPSSQHAIAIDASRSRLYLFENTTPAGNGKPADMRLMGDFFISVGKSGIRKRVEGDGRTPLGIYYVTSMRDRKTLPEFYGAGALPINYPNALDMQRQQTGGGIWLHGTPPNQFVRAPLASDGCVVLSNPDMEHLLKTVSPKTTPVVIAEQLQWVKPQALDADRDAFERVLQRWQAARSAESPDVLKRYLSPRFASRSGTPPQLAPEMAYLAPTDVRLGATNVSLLQWNDQDQTMVATFEETVNDRPTGVVRRQYWTQQGSEWQIFQDNILDGTPMASLRRPAAVPQPTQMAATEALGHVRSGSVVAAHAPTATSMESSNTSSGSTQEVQHAVHAWAKAWSQKNMSAYLGAYDKSFVPPGGMSRRAWEQERHDRIAYKSRIEVSVIKPNVKLSGQTASVTFIQNYRADQLKVSAQKTLKLIRRGDHWLITHESVGGH